LNGSIYKSVGKVELPTISFAARNANQMDVLRATHPEACPPEFISWLAVKEAVDCEVKDKKNLKRGSMDEDQASTTRSGSSVQLMHG
jgi:hypothetical protein